MPNPSISQITLPNNTTYDIKDAKARQDISDLTGAMSGAMHWVGVTTTALTDGSETQTITVDSKSYTATAGDVVAYGTQEYIWSDVSNTWRDFGSLGSLKALAFKDSASGSFTPSGTVSQPSFTGTENSGVTVSAAGSGDATYTPAGTVSQPTFSGTEVSFSTNFTPSGSVAISTGSGTANYTPAGTVTQPSFTGTEATLVVSGGSGDATYTPAGSVSKPDITVTPSTATVNSITAVGTLPELTTTVSNENLSISFSQGTLPTKGSDTSVLSGVTAALASTPSFTGTGSRLTATYTPVGTVSQPSFSGTAVELTGAFTGTEGTVSGNVTAAGTVSQPTFSGTGARLITAAFTPAGTVSQPTFSGTEGTVTVS